MNDYVFVAESEVCTSKVYDQALKYEEEMRSFIILSYAFSLPYSELHSLRNVECHHNKHSQ